MIDLRIDDAVTGLMAGVVSASGITIAQSDDALRAACAAAVERVKSGEPAGGSVRRDAVRQMLRAGGFKPSGRNKPAQEYLLRTVTEQGELPSILNAVDWLNAVSLECGLPISMLARSRLGESAIIRYGKADEKFVFNRAGQELDLEGLVCVCAEQPDGTAPLGTPIKDSMTGKIVETDQQIVAVIYAPSGNTPRDELERWCHVLGSGYRDFCGAASFDVAIRGSD